MVLHVPDAVDNLSAGVILLTLHGLGRGLQQLVGLGKQSILVSHIKEIDSHTQLH